MKDLLKYALLAGAGYFAWDWWRKRQAPAAAPPAEPSAVGITPELQALLDTLKRTSAGGVQPAGGTTKDAVRAEAERRGLPALMSADEWGWVYQQVRGVTAPDPATVWPDRDRGYKMSLEEWWSGVSAHGVSGLGGILPAGTPYLVAGRHMRPTHWRRA